MKQLLLIIIILFTSGCAEHHVDTVEEWCEEISGKNLAKLYEPSWGVFFSVYYNGEQIRDHYVKILNDAYTQKSEGRSDKMVWREGTELHMINLSALFLIDESEIVNAWKDGMESYRNRTLSSEEDICLYGTLSTAFDLLHIHAYEHNVFGELQFGKKRTKILKTQRQNNKEIRKI